MSRLIDALNRAVKSAPQPIGFRTTRRESAEPTIRLIARLDDIKNADNPAERAAGADAFLLRSGQDAPASTLKKLNTSLKNAPWGIWLDDLDGGKMTTLVDAGCDFVVFPAASRVLATPQDDKVGKILQIESSLGEGLLRAINDMPVDAVMSADVCEIGEPVAWQHLLILQRLANLLTKPLLVPVSPDINATELKALWEAGVDGVIIQVDGLPEGLTELRQAISQIKFAPARRRGKAEALLPRTAPETGAAPDEDEEEFRRSA
jgi:hypothetical protein